MATLLDKDKALRLEQEVLKADIAEVAAFLQDHLGQQATIYLSGLKDPKVVGMWARSESKPRDHWIEARLRHAYQAARLLIEAYGAETARSWFWGTSSLLDRRAPALVLRNAKTPEDLSLVIAAVETFVNGC